MTFASPIDLWHTLKPKHRWSGNLSESGVKICVHSHTIEGKGIGDQKAGPKGFNFLIFKK
jgi:hypothetical protein